MRNAILASIAATTTVAGLTAQAGSFTNSGTGCPTPYCSNNAIYEVMAAGAWDLDNTGITFTRTSPTYLAVPGGVMIPLTAPTSVSPGDDSVTGPFPIGFTFNYEGGAGSTTAVDVSSNGHVYLEPGTIVTSRCCSGTGALGNFISGTPSVAVLGTDLNPTQGGSVHYETIAAATNPVTSLTESVFVVEWLNVPEYFNANSNTAQCQLWQSGDIVIVHGTTSNTAATDSALVGVSTGGGQVACDNGIDLSTALPYVPSGPFEFVTPLTLALSSGAPNVGSTITLTANNLPGDTIAGAMLIGSAQTSLPLDIIGATGCSLLVDAVFASPALNLALPTGDLSIPISSNPGTIGLTFHFQAAAIAPSANALGLAVSDLGSMTIGGQFNDECSTAAVITDGLYNGTNSTATRSAITGSCGLMGADVWYTYVATCTGTATVSFCTPGTSASFDTVLAAFDGSCGALNQIVCNDDNCVLSSEISFPTTAGNLYYIAIGSFNGGGSGPFTVDVSCQ